MMIFKPTNKQKVSRLSLVLLFFILFGAVFLARPSLAYGFDASWLHKEPKDLITDLSSWLTNLLWHNDNADVNQDTNTNTSWVKDFLATHPEYKEEDIVKRDEYSIHFKRPDGQIEAQILQNPINYKDDQGQWDTLDTAITSSDDSLYNYQNITNSFKTYFSSNAYQDDGNIKLVKGDATLTIKTIDKLTFTDRNETFTLSDLSPKTEEERQAKKGVVDEQEQNKICYPKLYEKEDKTMDVCYIVKEGRIQEQLILNAYQGFPELTQTIILNNAYAKKEGKQITFYNTKTNELLWYILDPVIYEQKDGAENRDLHYDLTCNQPNTSPSSCSDLSITKILEPKAKDYLADPQRQYPVVIDPDYAGNTGDSFIYSDATTYAPARSTSGYFASTQDVTQVGQYYSTSDAGHYSCFRTFYKFDTSSIPDGETVLQVNLKLTAMNTDIASKNFDIQIVKLNWSGQDPISDGNRETAYDACLAGTADSSIWRNTSGMAMNTQYASGNLATAWVSKTGFTYYCLRSSYDFAGTAPTVIGGERLWIYSQEASTADYRPILTVVYTTPTGPTGVWQSCETGTLSCGNSWDYSMGYQFTPTKNGQITHLCGQFSGTKWVRLYNSAYSILASAQVTSSNIWSCTSITPVNVNASQVYYVVVEAANSSGCYRYYITGFPTTCQGVTINNAAYQYPSGSFDSSHESATDVIYGIADVVFVETTASYTLSVSKTGTGSGTVTSSPSGIDCGSTCSANFSSGTVILTAIASGGSTFTGWSGDCSGMTCTVSMTANRSVTANFNTTSAQIGVWQSCEIGTLVCDNAWPYSMGYQLTPTKNGQITYLCGQFSGTKWVRLYNSAYSVLASAQVTSSNTWSCTSITPVNVSASQVYYVVVELAGSGGCYRSGTTFPLTCQGVTIDNSVYQSPSGTFNSSHTSDATWYMYGIADVVFVEGTASYTLSVSKTGTGSGAVTSNPSGIDCGSTCSTSFSSGTSVTLTATAAGGSTFIGWSGEGCSGTGTCSVSMTANRSVTANFNTITYSLSVSKTGTGSGAVTSNPSGIDCGATCSASFSSGTSVTLTATASGGSNFTGWSGDCSGMTCTVSMTANRSVTANFNTITGYSCQEHNVSGWAWSENIGWISFSCKNQGVAGNYGVDIADSTGLLSGYTWSENIGWITFNESELTGCPTSPCQAKLDLGTKQIYGWARACSVFQTGCSGALDPNRGGWDGWIKLRDTSYRAWVNNGVSPAEFRDWAWSDMNIGWITFNCVDRSCATSNYKVITNFFAIQPPVNQPPVADFSCQPTSCTIYTGEALTFNNNSSDPDNNLARSEWDILNWGLVPDLTCCASGCDSSTILCNYTVQSSIMGRGTYNANLTVKDALNETSSLTKPFSIKQDIIADFKCSLDNSIWQSCDGFHAQFGAKVYFQDQSTPSEGASISSWAWAFTNGTPATANIANPQTRFYSVGIKQVSLTVTDTASRSASKSYNLQIDISFPEWEEIAPF